MTNLRSFNISSLTSEARSNGSGFMVSDLERPSIAKKGRGVGTRLSFLVSSKRKLTTKKRKLMPDLDSSSWLLSQLRGVMHNHTSRLLFERSGFIISHFELAAKFSPTAVASNYDNSNSRLGGIWLCLPDSPNSLLLSGRHANHYSVCLVPLFCTVSPVFQFVMYILSANGLLATVFTTHMENCHDVNLVEPNPILFFGDMRLGSKAPEQLQTGFWTKMNFKSRFWGQHAWEAL